MKKAIWTIILCLISIYVYFIFYPIIIERNGFYSEVMYVANKKRGDKIKVFDSYNFEEGNWKVCVLINERVEISPNIPFGRYLYTEDINVIKRLKDMSFEYTGADITTVENEIILYKDNQIIFRSGIVIDTKKQGLQNGTFGWIEDKNHELGLIIRNFQLNLLPFVYL